MEERFDEKFEKYNNDLSKESLDEFKSFTASELKLQREGMVEMVRERKAKHDIEKDPSGTFSICLLCGEKGARVGEYCETMHNLVVDDIISHLSLEDK